MPVGILGKGGEAGESVAGATSATQKREEEENQEGGVPTMPTNADGDTSKDWYISDKVIAYFTVPALDIQIKRRYNERSNEFVRDVPILGRISIGIGWHGWHYPLFIIFLPPPVSLSYSSSYLSSSTPPTFLNGEDSS